MWEGIRRYVAPDAMYVEQAVVLSVSEHLAFVMDQPLVRARVKFRNSRGLTAHTNGCRFAR